jgi:hypothetical protein
MTDALEIADGPAPSANALALRKKIGWLCQIIRGLGIVWALWILYEIVAFWGDPARARGAYSHAFQFDAASISTLNYYTAFALQLIVWALAARVAWALWRLFTHYLNGDTFTVSAALALRRLAMAGAVALGFSILERPAIFALMIAGHEVAGRSGWFFRPDDLLDTIFVTFVFSLAYIFKTAAELADEHAQIV